MSADRTLADHVAVITGETITIDGGAWLGGGTFGFEV
jgi:hypothetical protein|tara:strand:+ start:281 stop:391 length:111 start_codon:yes stop_codon:yes gene_type:complete